MVRHHHLVSTECSTNGTKTIRHHLPNAKCSRTSSLWNCWLTNSRLQFAGVGSRGSALTVVRFNQGSKQDVEALVDYIYATLGMDLDYILPVAAIPENGRRIDSLDDIPELAHRVGDESESLVLSRPIKPVPILLYVQH